MSPKPRSSERAALQRESGFGDAALRVPGRPVEVSKVKHMVSGRTVTDALAE